jgi:tetrahydromethanopterin S-methyltransferase subunit A
MHTKEISVLIIILFVFTGLFSCTNNSGNAEELSPLPESEAVQNMRRLLITPDSLRTDEENALIQKIENILYERCIIENDRFCLTINKQEWTENGLSEEFYDMLAKDVKVVNNFLDTTTSSIQVIIDEYKNAQNKYKIKQKEE